MKGLNRIIEKIKKDAEREAGKIKKEYEEKIKQIKEQNRKTLQAEEKKLKKEMEMHLELLESKTLSKARLEAKNRILKAREEMIGKVIEAVRRELEKNFDQLIESRLKDYAGQDVAVVCGSGDRKLVEKLGFKAEEGDVEGIVIKEGEGKQVRINVEDELEQLMPEIRKAIGGIIK